MSNNTVSAFEHTVQTAYTWIGDIAEEFDTEDREFVYRVLRAWLQTLRDRLTVEASARFAAQLPDLIRGIFYAGWDPDGVPQKYDGEAYAARFASEANIAVPDVPKAAAATTAGILRSLPAAQLDKALDQLPAEIRALLQPQP